MRATLQVTVTYEVGGGGHLDIDFYVRFPYSLSIRWMLVCWIQS